jgi:hypothetical protein
MNNWRKFTHELKHHLPFTLSATALAVIVVSILIFGFNIIVNEEEFEFLHYIHIFASAIVSAGILYKYKKNIPLALLVGLVSSIIVGSISDIIFPFAGGKLFSFAIQFHLPLIEAPLWVIGSAILGTIIGIMTKITKFPHFVHIFISIFASLFYILAFVPTITPLVMALSILIVFVAVLVPCCISDILMPFLFLGKDLKSCHCYDH